MTEGTERYCDPIVAGLSSEPAAVGRKLGKLLDALDEVNSNICDGAVVDRVHAMRVELLDKLRAEGWRISAGDTKWKVLPPKAAA